MTRRQMLALGLGAAAASSLLSKSFMSEAHAAPLSLPHNPAPDPEPLVEQAQVIVVQPRRRRRRRRVCWWRRGRRVCEWRWV
jgi:hypothetical protein